MKVVYFRGKPTCTCVAKWIPALEAKLRQRGLLSGNLYIYQLRGLASASAGTHSQGGAIDCQRLTGAQRVVARQMGGASWGRGPAQGMVNHEHIVLIGCAHNAPARYQVSAYKRGYSGLGYGGVASRDPFQRVSPIRTWKQGIKWATKKAAPKKPKGLFGMAHTRFMRQSKNRRVKAGKKRILPFRAKNGSSSLLWKPTKDWEARVNVHLTGVPAGRDIKGQFVWVKGNSNKIVARHPVVDHVASNGADALQFTCSGSLPKGRRLRFMLWVPSSDWTLTYSEAYVRWL